MDTGRTAWQCPASSKKKKMEGPLPQAASLGATFSEWPPCSTTTWGNTELFPSAPCLTWAPRSAQVKLPFCLRLLNASFAQVSLFVLLAPPTAGLVPWWAQCACAVSCRLLQEGLVSKFPSNTQLERVAWEGGKCRLRPGRRLGD
jgi:hypothetical protein